MHIVPNEDVSHVDSSGSKLSTVPPKLRVIRSEHFLLMLIVEDYLGIVSWSDKKRNWFSVLEHSMNDVVVNCSWIHFPVLGIVIPVCSKSDLNMINGLLDDPHDILVSFCAVR